MTLKEITNDESAVYLHDEHFEENGIKLIQNSSEEIKMLVIEAEKRLIGKWQDLEGDKLFKKFIDIFPNKKLFKHVREHGVIKGRIGSSFLKNNQWWLKK